MSLTFQKIKKFCCCISNGIEDTEQLISNDYDYNWINGNNASVTRNFNFNTLHSSAGSSGGADISRNRGAKTQSEIEEEALNKILDRTQQSIIDVGNLDSNNGMDADIAYRARLYNDAIRRYDKMIEKKNNAEGSNLNYLNSPANLRLLVDIGDKIGDILSESPLKKLNVDDFHLITYTVDFCDTIVSKIMLIELQEELIAFMHQEE